MSRVQQDKEDWMQYLDALEGLRTQGFPDELITVRRYEILQRFTDGVRDPKLRRELSAAEVFSPNHPLFNLCDLQRDSCKDIDHQPLNLMISDEL